LRHYVRILSVAVTVCNIYWHFWNPGWDFTANKPRLTKALLSSQLKGCRRSTLSKLAAQSSVGEKTCPLPKAIVLDATIYRIGAIPYGIASLHAGNPPLGQGCFGAIPYGIASLHAAALPLQNKVSEIASFELVAKLDFDFFLGAL